jgi:hypothetical protein
LPQQFIKNPLEQFESEKLAVGWPWRLFTISLIIFGVILFVYFGLIIGYEPYLQSKIQEKDGELNQLAQIVSKEDQEKFIGFYSQLTNLKTLLEKHIAVSKLFPLLERITNQKVYFSGANLKTLERELELEGFAESYGILGEQLESFDQTKEISNYILDQSHLSEGKVQFKVKLKLKDDVIK